MFHSFSSSRRVSGGARVKPLCSKPRKHWSFEASIGEPSSRQNRQWILSANAIMTLSFFRFFSLSSLFLSFFSKSLVGDFSRFLFSLRGFESFREGGKKSAQTRSISLADRSSSKPQGSGITRWRHQAVKYQTATQFFKSFSHSKDIET